MLWLISNYFKTRKIRSVWNEEEEQWYFSVVDVVEALTDSPNPRQYWRKMKDRDLKEFESYPFWVQLKLQSADGKKYSTDCANVKGLFVSSNPFRRPRLSRSNYGFRKWAMSVCSKSRILSFYRNF